MNRAEALLSRLRDMGDGVLLQEDPYPVVAPQSVEQAVACISAARDEACVVMPLGSGSSFPGDFSLLRERLLAVMAVRLNGSYAVSPFAIRVLSGLPVSVVAIECVGEIRRTLGGFIAGARTGLADPILRAIWAQTRAMEVITGEGKLHTFAGPALSGSHSGGASLFIGSRGRLGMIVSIELAPPLPIRTFEIGNSETRGSVAGAMGGGPILGSGEIRSMLDPHGLFQW